MQAKRAWILYLLVLVIYYLNYIVTIYHNEMDLSSIPLKDVVFVLFHGTLFLLVNLVLIPKLFYTKRYGWFFIALFSLMSLYAVIEEGILEPWLTPSRGNDPVTAFNIFLFWGEISVPLLAFITLKFMIDNFAQQQRLEQIEKDQLTNELKLLKSQIQPHVLFNSLNNLYNFTLTKSDKAPELVLKLSNVLRYITYETASEKVPLTKELVFIEDYIDLQKVQYEGRGVIQYQIEKAATTDRLKIAPFILIPFVENAFKHSFGSKIKAVEISIRVEVEEQSFRFFVQNNFEKQSISTQKLTIGGIGLQNVRQRLELLYPAQHQLIIDQQNEHYQIILQLNLI